MLEKVRKYIEAEGLLSLGTRVVVGFSGGADSVCLLEALRLLAPELGLTLFALHVHHGIRGAEADGDAAYAAKFCEKRGIPLRTVFRDIPAEARAKGLGLEEAGRLARRGELSRALRELPADAAALAHHKNDLAETMLFQLARGTGLAGLSGISPVSGSFIRPLLCLTRGEIEAWLKSRGIAWREDSTNADTAYARNRIRHEALPALSKVNAQAVTHMAEASGEIREAYAYLESLLSDKWRRCAAAAPEGARGILLIAEAVLAEPALFQRMLVREAFRRLGGLKDLGKVHVEAVLDLLRGKEGRRRDLPGLSAVRTAEGAALLPAGDRQVSGRERIGDAPEEPSVSARKTPEDARKRDLPGERAELKIPGETTFDGWKFTAELLRLPQEDGEALPSSGEIGRKRGPEELMFTPSHETIVKQACHPKRSEGARLNHAGVSDFDEILRPDGLRMTGPLHAKHCLPQNDRAGVSNPEETGLPWKSQNHYTKWFDYDKIEKRIELRRRENGDFLTIHPDGRRKTLSNLFTDRKVPREERDRVALLAAGQEILWAVGIRAGESARVDEGTRAILRVSAERI